VSFKNFVTYIQSRANTTSKFLVIFANISSNLIMFTRDYVLLVRVMTYNIRMDTVNDGINQWNLRKNRVFRLIQQYQPDLIDVQEALSHQLADLYAAFPSFGWYGIGRDDSKDKGEFSAIFYHLSLF
jgi:endonuclease/exonuclease/phosphatase family metal-dependent hydrolase